MAMAPSRRVPRHRPRLSCVRIPRNWAVLEIPAAGSSKTDEEKAVLEIPAAWSSKTDERKAVAERPKQLGGIRS